MGVRSPQIIGILPTSLIGGREGGLSSLEITSVRTYWIYFYFVSFIVIVVGKKNERTGFVMFLQFLYDPHHYIRVSKDSSLKEGGKCWLCLI
jgi:hypothetical protein